MVSLNGRLFINLRLQFLLRDYAGTSPSIPYGSRPRGSATGLKRNLNSIRAGPYERCSQKTEKLPRQKDDER